MKHLLQVLFLAFLPCLLWSQPANDACSNAIQIENVTNWCSNSGEFTNIAATVAVQSNARCITSGSTDVWFSFTAVSTNANIRVLGNVVDIYGVTAFSQGSLTIPGIALYSGTCDDLTLIDCDQDDTDHIAEIFAEDLIPNATYFIQVSSAVAASGTFQLCLSSFSLVPDPISDCPTGVVLCDKSSFFVPNIQGAGNIANEVNTSCLNMEDNSTWYKWVAGSSGSLTFSIVPNNPGDDLDFAVFELPNGLNDCSDMIELRCMASGANGINLFGPFIAAPFDQWDQCAGPTGLRVGDSQVTETAGCNEATDDNFVSAIEMEEGRAYALVVLNFSASGHGFSLEFGGTGDFLGPTADFITDDLDGTVCFGEPVSFFDQSSFGSLTLVEWQWNFGEGASPQSATGPGPHEVKYGLGGVKSIALTVESETGCLITEIGSIIVEDPFEVLADVTDQSCPESQDGQIALDIKSGSNITSIQWDNGSTGQLIDRLDPGDYEVTITNFNGCDTVIPYIVEAPMPLEIQDIITRPSCGGGADGSITLNVDGQAPPFLFDFGSGFSTDNMAAGLVADIYAISIQDNNGCITEIEVALGEINIDLDPDFDPIQPPSCFGFDDGRVEVRIVGGETPYAFFWNGTPSPDNFLDGVGSGPLTVAIRDGFNCLGFAQFDVTEPDELIVNLDTLDISCFAAMDGRLSPLVFGGTGSYTYDWDFGSNDSLAQNLAEGNYQVDVTDVNGCVTTAAGFIAEPPELGILIDSTQDAICFGEATGALFFQGFGGSPPFQYSIDGTAFSDNLSFQGLTAGAYSISIKDDRGCINTIEAEIFQPQQITVNAGNDTFVDLGFSAQLLATHTPINQPVDYQWEPPGDCENCPFTTVLPLRSTIYTVQIVNEDGCRALDSVEVLVFGNKPIYVPNAFSPNGDGFNDRVAIYGGTAAEQIQGVRRLQIFDRWGEMVFDGKNLDIGDETMGWDGNHRGQPMNPGVFAYLAEVAFIDGSTLQFEGDITLIR